MTWWETAASTIIVIIGLATIGTILVARSARDDGHHLLWSPPLDMTRGTTAHNRLDAYAAAATLSGLASVMAMVMTLMATVSLVVNGVSVWSSLAMLTSVVLMVYALVTVLDDRASMIVATADIEQLHSHDALESYPEESTVQGRVR